jgi:hypothetical protein
MCGIVGVASNNKVSFATLELFKSLLLHDVVRGHHATGVAAINTAENTVAITKEAIPSYEFLENYEIIDDCNIYIGHNRWATRGDKTKDEHAHPFTHGNITGVHNGSLRDQSLLDDHTDFEVDSDNLFNHLARNGLEDTAKNLNGAFAIVYYDESDRTLNLMRNSERPLFIARLNNGSIAWASESLMLEWLVDRSKTLSFKQKDGKSMIYSLEVGVHYKISFSGFKMTKQENTKHDLYTYTPPAWNTTEAPWEKKLFNAIKAINSFADKDSWFEVKVLGTVGAKKTLEYTHPNGSKFKMFTYAQTNLKSTAWVKITTAYLAGPNESDKDLINTNGMMYVAGTVSADRPQGAVFTSGSCTRGEAKVILANGKCTLDELREYRLENKDQCANCGNRLNKVWPSQLHLLVHLDQEARETFHYLSCTPKCHNEMVQFCAEIDYGYSQGA